MERISDFQVPADADQNVIIGLLNEFRTDMAAAFENADPNDPQANYDALIDIYDGKAEDLDLQALADNEEIRTLVDAGQIDRTIEQLRVPVGELAEEE